MNKRLPFLLITLYFLPWGIQCLVNNFIPVYVDSLPFASAQTVGDVVGLGALITTVSQLTWSFFAGKAKNKSNLLALSLLLLSVFSLLFLIKEITKPTLFIFVILFYSTYMAHQPIIDTIASENYSETRFSFGFYRSFASLGYAIFALLLVLLPSDDISMFFLYSAILALLSSFCAKSVPGATTSSVNKKRNTRIFNSSFICFLIYTLVLFFCSSSFSSFFSVYYTSSEHLGGSISAFSILICIFAIAEWLLVMLFARLSERLGATLSFLFIPLSGVVRVFTVFLAETPAAASLSFVGCALWFGILWASVTPYIRSIVPPEGGSFAHGVWGVASSGIGSFLGSFFSGRFVERFGMKSLFLFLTFVLISLALATPLLIPPKKRRSVS